MNWQRIGLLIRINAAAVALPLILELPLWISGIWAASVLADFALFQFSRTRVPGRLPAIIVIGASLLVLRHYKTLFGQEPSGALLAILLALKLMEGREYREYMIAVFLTYFLVLGKLLFSQTLVTTIYMFASLVSTTLMLYLLHAPFRKGRTDLVPALRQTGKTLALGVPILVLLFFVFPRFTSPFVRWVNNTKPRVGFSDSLNPGDLGQLALSNETAFRAEFKELTRLSPEQLYWRGSVLSKSTGMIWSRPPDETSTPLESETERKLRQSSSLVHYEVSLEPQYRTWLFALDIPVDISLPKGLPIRLLRRPGHTFTLQDPAISRIKYDGVSFLGKRDFQSQVLPHSAVRKAYLEIPDEVTPKIRALVEKLVKDSHTDQDKVQSLLRHFARSGFLYTLQPGGLRKGNQLEQFLFETKKGFCEHFSASFSVLARVAGIPSRVVTGFQGGEYNSVGGYYQIRERDAHAWAEVHIAGRGWTRVDPTEVVAPDRIRNGGEYLNTEFGANLLGSDIGSQILEVARMSQPGFAQVFETVAMNWDAVTYRWHSFLLNYDLQYQKELLKSLGLDHWGTGFLFALVVLGTLVLGVLLAKLLRMASTERDLNAELLDRLYKK